VIKLINLNHIVVASARDVVVTASVYFVIPTNPDLMLLFALLIATN
jgi:hypothetical protein